MTDIALEEWLLARLQGEQAVKLELPKSDYVALRTVAQATRDRIARALLASRVPA